MYVQFREEEQAGNALRNLQGRFYAGLLRLQCFILCLILELSGLYVSLTFFEHMETQVVLSLLISPLSPTSVKLLVDSMRKRLANVVDTATLCT